MLSRNVMIRGQQNVIDELLVINTNFLPEHVNEPTRRSNILDLVMTTPDLRKIGLEVTDKIGDHPMIDFALEVHDSNTRTQQKYALDYKQAHFEPMKKELGSIHYEVLARNKNTDECYKMLKEKIATATEHRVPTKRMKPINESPWSSLEIKRLINARQHSYRKLKQYPIIKNIPAPAGPLTLAVPVSTTANDKIYKTK
ncbi:hypothetical protein FHG87_005920 [Trinorchestia longiramus]|nr:hypothetical protein FHG87_005920 [Trinorchestia longiramus]